MTPGRMIAVVGPSGVGKDSVMQGVARTLPRIHLVKRVITRAPELGGEDYRAVSPQEFEAMAAEGFFALHWSAHGLRYGIPADVFGHLDDGVDCLANFSRKALTQAAAVFPGFTVLNISASPETLAARLAARGRETGEEIADRLAEAHKPLPKGLDVIHLGNDGALSETVARAAALLQPASV